MLDRMDIDYIRSSAHILRFPCPYHEGLHNNFCINTEDTTFICHVCKEKGAAPEFVAHWYKISPMAATRMLKERYVPGFINPYARDTVEEVKRIIERRERPPIVQALLDESELERFSVNWPEAWMAWKTPGWESFPPCDYLFERGFEPEWLEDWEFGWDERSQRITFAVRDEQGRLVGFKARATDGREPKYRVLGDTPRSDPYYGWPPYYTGLVAFGAHKIQLPCKELVLLEGEWNAIAIQEKLEIPAVAINGSNFTKTQARIIRNITDSVIVFLDSDEAGEDATWGWEDHSGEWHKGVVEQLCDFVSVRIVPEHEGDPMDNDGPTLKRVIDAAKSSTIARLPLIRSQ
jgi:DNA primase